MARTKQEIDQSIINSIFPNTNNSATSSPTRSHHSQHHLGGQTSRPTSAASSNDRHKDPALLEAVRDTVQYTGSSNNSPVVVSSGSRGGSVPNTAPPTLGPVEGEILNISGGFGSGGAGGGGGGHGYSKSISALGGAGSPGSEEVVDEREGVVRSDRVRFDRSVGLMPSRTGSSTSTTTLTTATPLHRIRRSQSSSSADFATLQSQLRVGQAQGDKKPSRHADIIDQWDLTGVGKSMWHHSGPYDAAAPSRNDARERAGERAPMMVFDPTRGSRVTELDGRALGNGYDSMMAGGYPSGSASAGVVVPGKRRSSIDKGKTNHNHSHGKLSSTPPISEDYVPTLSTQIVSAKPKPARHASSPGIFGSLQEEYSSSMPASGGYLSAREAGMGGGGVGGEEEDSERRIRQKEREQKRRALQAAWGIDEPEPYEDFGGYPSRQDDNYVLNDDPIDNEFASPFPTPGTGGLTRDRPLKSPNGASRGFSGLIRSASRGGAGKSPMSPAEGMGAAGDSYFPSGAERKGSVGAGGGEVISPGVGGANGKGLKRTKSLMQRIKAMRDNPNVPVNEESGRRSSSPNTGRMSPWKEDTLGIMNSSSESMENGQQNGSTGRSAGSDGKPARKNSLLGGRRRPSRLDSGATSHSDQAEEVLVAEQPLDSGNAIKFTGAGYQPTPSSQVPPNPRKTSGGILTNAGQPQPQRSRGLSGSGRFGGRDKALPPPPPPAPVFPNFEGEYNDLPGKMNDGLNLNEGGGGGGSGMQRKTSLMKKFKGKVGL